MKPLRCYAGQFFGGYPDKYEKTRGRAKLAAIKLVCNTVTADTATKVELEDWHALRTSIPDRQQKKAYQASHVDQLFHHNSSVDDGDHFFDFSDRPIDCIQGIKVRTNINCRPILYVE